MSTEHLVLPITGMTCANCAVTIERSLKRVGGVQSATVNLASERATFAFDTSQVKAVDPEKFSPSNQTLIGVQSGFGLPQTVKTGPTTLCLRTSATMYFGNRVSLMRRWLRVG